MCWQATFVCLGLLDHNGRINQMSSKSCVSCSYRAASLQSSRENLAARLRVQIPPRSCKDRTVSDLCSHPVPGSLGQGTHVPLPGLCGLAPALGGVLAKLFPPGSRRPGAGIQSRHTQPCTSLHPSCLPSVGVSPLGCRLRAG